MARKIKQNIFRFLIPALITIIAGFLAWKNYTPGTFLIGWDSLHPEFNFPEAFKRIIFGVFRPEQGLGAIAAHSHMSDLPRVLILWLASFVLPLNTLRYFYIFAMMIIGPIGAYKFLKYFFGKKGIDTPVYFSSFIGALFYLVNVGTMQHFLVPFEMFVTAFGFVPWLVYFATKFLTEGGKHNLLKLSVILVLASPMAYAATLFYATFIGIFIFIFSYALLTKERLLKVRRAFGVLLMVFALNSYWILPGIYSVRNQSQTIENAKINELFSPEAFLRNQDYGNWKDILTNKNFLFSWRAYGFNQNTYVDLTDTWNNYLANPNIDKLILAFGFITILGFALSLVRRERIAYAIFPLVLHCLFFLININPPTGALYSYLYDHIGIFREGFRMPFTKFSIPFIFAQSVFFGYFFYFLFQKLGDKGFKKILIILTSLGTISLLVISVKPAFEGQFISPYMKLNVPEEYFNLFDWFKARPGRVAVLPIHTMWGWEYRNWGYQGSGFLTYGIANPILYRDFDRWNAQNETFYDQASFNIYSEDIKGLEDTLKKYNVKYLLLDESIINAGGTDDVLYIDKIKNMLLASEHIRKVEISGSLAVYETDFDNKQVFVPKAYVKVNQNQDYALTDNVYSQYGDYITNLQATSYPFNNFDKRADVKISYFAGNVIFENQKTNTRAQFPLKPIITEDFTQKRGFDGGYNCDLKKLGEATKQNLGEKIVYSARGSGVSCDYFSYPELSYSKAYLFRITGENLSGRGLKIYLYNYKTKRMDLEELLPTGKFDESYLLVPSYIEGEGYSLNLETRSFGKVESENILTGVQIYEVPYDFLTKVYKGDETLNTQASMLAIKNVRNVASTIVLADIQGSGLLTFDQGYEQGWLAFNIGFNGLKSVVKSLEHVRVNGWENGWIVEDDKSQILIFYWPQLLEWGGFALAFASLTIVVNKVRI